MNKRIKRAIVFMMVFSVLLGSLPSFRDVSVKAADSDVIRNDETGIPDKALYQMILQALGQTPDSTFTEEEAQKVEGLVQLIYAEGDSKKRAEKVASVQGIEKLTNLRIFHPGRKKKDGEFTCYVVFYRGETDEKKKDQVFEWRECGD